ncbi:MAG: polysaccharide biosynthesis C-terminal domain-containing protein [Bernardetiaceae bacterium]
MSLLKKLASQTAYYGLSSVVGRLLNYLLVPFHTGVFSTEAYGIVSDFYAHAALLQILFVYGMETTFFQFVAHKKQDLRETFSLILTRLIVSSGIFFVILWYAADGISAWMGYPEKGMFVRWFGCILVFDTLAMLPFARLRLEGKARRFAFLKLGQILLTVLLNIGFLYLLPKAITSERWAFLSPLYVADLGLGYVFLSNLIANGLLLVWLLPHFRGFYWRWSWAKFSPMWRYAYPLIFTGIAYTINEVADRSLLKYLLPEGFYAGLSTLDAVGVYSGCYKLSIFITLAVQAFKYAAEPFFFAQAAERDSPQTFARLMRYFVIACAGMIVLVSAELRLLQVVFLRQPAYAQGLVVVPFLLFANTFLGMYYNLSVWFKVTDRTYYGTWISLIGMGVTLLLNVLLIPHLGYLGSAIATFACYLTMALVCYLWGQRFYPIPYPVGAVMGYLGLAAVLSAVAFGVAFAQFWVDQVFRLGILGIFVGVVWQGEKKRAIPDT